MSKRKTALLMAMAAAIQKSMGYQLDVSCTPIDFVKGLNHSKQQQIKRNSRKQRRVKQGVEK